MSNYLFLLPLSLALGLVGLATFLWTLRKNQYDDLEGARFRILEDDDYPLPTPNSDQSRHADNDSSDSLNLPH